MFCSPGCDGTGRSFDLPGMMAAVREKLAEHGIDFDACFTSEEKDSQCTPKVKVVCVAPDLQASAREMSESAPPD